MGSFTAIAECVCGAGKIVGYASVYGVTLYKHLRNTSCVSPQPKQPVNIVDGIVSVEELRRDN